MEFWRGKTTYTDVEACERGMIYFILADKSPKEKCFVQTYILVFAIGVMILIGL